ncbi:TadE/TadG family type IV pilus assembly protein [uncultured Demequina sp.]|uniref:TadE/TadG family type IV pilus assembly protein n=1 Tax=uncultured Demequina sp. TaxID=693499 RepID=UPI0025D73CA7|nr:TadE/TadG family type IV pilus assembly protein [uncultured Demequina sp.]
MRSTPSPAGDAARDRGSAVVEFVLVASLVVLLGLALLQLVLAVHVRNTLTSSAYEGARIAAQADRTLADGEARAEAMAAEAMAGVDTTATASASAVDGADLVLIELSAPLPVIGLWGPGTLTVEARAIAESP